VPQAGIPYDMPDEPDSKRVQSRADTLLPEEQEAGSDDPQLQAETILAESDARAAYRRIPEAAPIERRTSEDTVEPPE
jgi:hypothetical protein